MSDRKIDLSRRKILAGLGTIGAASAGAGLGTSAYFTDEESFTGNRLEAGELNLVVDYATSVDQGSASVQSNTTGSGSVDGSAVQAEYVINDVKPGDSGKLVFCPKVVDNPAWLFAGSDGAVDYENGQTDPEGDVDASGGDPGKGAGELSENVQVTVSYCEFDGGDRDDPDDYSTIRELNNPDDYTLADLALDLQTGFLLDGDSATSGRQAYPGSADASTQEGPCVCLDWEVPTSVGNEIQTDSLEFGVQFAAIQERHNPEPNNPFIDSTYSESQVKDRGQGSDGTTYYDVANFSALREPTVDVAIGDELVVFQAHPTAGMIDDANMSLAFDEDGAGGYDFQVVWDLDASAKPPSGDNFSYYSTAVGSYEGVPDEIVVDYDSANNVFTIGVPKSRLNASGNGEFGFVFQTIHNGASNVPSAIDGQSLDAEVPLDFSFGNSADFITVSL